MTEQTAAVVETPKRKIRLRVPSRQTLKKVATHTSVAALAGLIGYRAAKNADNCACESDTADTAGTTDN